MCKFHVFKPIYIAIFEKNDDLDYFEKKKWRSLQGGTLVFYLSSLQGDPCVSFFFNWQESTLEKKKKNRTQNYKVFASWGREEEDDLFVCR